MHAKAHTLATLISVDPGTPSGLEGLARAVEALFEGCSDEQKADLYALVEENRGKAATFTELVDIVSDCLIKNERHFVR
jgi:hypothetical protein